MVDAIHQDLHELRARIDLRELVEAAGASFTHAGSAICPLHPGADNPSAFHLYRGHDGVWRWHCFTRCPSDQNDGDAITFYMRWRHVDFATAVQELARRYGAAPGPINGPPAAPPCARWQARAAAFALAAQQALWSPAGRAARAYLQTARGLAPATIQRWGLGYHPRDTWDPPAAWGGAPAAGVRRIWCPAGIVLPAWQDGRVTYLKVRRPLPGDPLAAARGASAAGPAAHGAKYVHIRGSRPGLYGAGLLRELPAILLAEGEFDALLAWQAANDFLDVATFGSAAQRLDAHAALTLAHAHRIFIAYDADQAGAAARAYWQSATHRAVPLRLPNLPGTTTPAHDITAFWQAGGDLRAWLAAACQAIPTIPELRP
jgi:DNA primase